MKRLIRIIISITLIMGLLPVPAGAAQDMIKEAFKVSIPVSPNGYISCEDFDVAVKLSHNGKDNRLYKIQIICTGAVFEQQISVPPEQTVSQTVRVTAKQGPCRLEIRIYYNGVQVYEEIEDTMVIVPYQRQFMEDISRKGINGVEGKNLHYFDLMGLQSTRVGYEWGWTERVKGNYDWPAVHKELTDAQAQPVFLAAYGNNLYSGSTNDKKGPTTKEEIDAYCTYAATAAKRYPSIKYFEIWNEPNISFWQPVPNVYDYVNLLEVASQELHEVNDSIVVIGGSMASSDGSYTQNLFQLNGGSYMDAFCDHPYTYPGEADIYLQNQLELYDEQVLKYGGWMINVSTEFGWPTNIGNRGVTVEKQAVETIKHYIITDYNDYEINQVYRLDDLAINGFHDESYNEDNFGLVYYDGTPKPAVAAVKALCEMTNGAVPYGMLDTPYGVNAYLYIKDGEPMAAAWRSARTNHETPYSLSFDHEVSYYDMYGNLSGTGMDVPLTETPVYIKGISKDTAAAALSSILNKKFSEKCALLNTAAQKPGYDKMKALLEQGVRMASLQAMPNEEALNSLLREYYDTVLGGMTELYKNGEFEGTIDDLTAMLYIAHLGGLRLMELYMMSVSSETDGLVSAQKAVDDAEAVIKSRAGSGTQSHAENVHKFAKETLEKLEMVLECGEENAMKVGMIKAWNQMTLLLCETAVRVSAVETPGYDNILLQLPSSEKEFVSGVAKTAAISLYNYTDEEIRGSVEIFDPAGRKAGQSADLCLASKDSMCVNIHVTFPDAFEDGELCTLRFTGENSVSKQTKAPVHIAQGGSFHGAMTTFSAPDADPDAADNEYRWMYSYDDISYHPMAFAAGKSYRVTNMDKNKYIMCRVTPIYTDESRGEPQEYKFGYISKLGTVSPEGVSQIRRFDTRFTPPENKFKLEGSEREYVLLDTFAEEEQSSYFILSDFLTANLEQHKTDPQNINPNDPNSIGYWLNTEFINNGYQLAGAAWPKFDSRIYKYVNKEHTWWVEAGIEGVDAEDTPAYSYTAGLGLLTESEAMKYWGVYGWNASTENGMWYNPWLLATGSAQTNQYLEIMNFKVEHLDEIYHAGEQTLIDVTPGNGHGELYARPAFYLNKDFFKKVRLDLSCLGENVKETIKNHYRYDELLEIYSQSELNEIGIFPESLSVISCESSGGKTTAAVKAQGAQTGLVITVVYNERNECTGISIDAPSERIQVQVDGEGTYMKIFWWNTMTQMKPVCPGIEKNIKS